MSEFAQSLTQNLRKTLDKMESDDLMVNREEFLKHLKSNVISTMNNFNNSYLALWIFFKDIKDNFFKSYILEKMKNAFVLDRPEFILPSNKHLEYQIYIQKGIENFKELI